MDKPTREEVDRAREWLDTERVNTIRALTPISADMVAILVAATAPPDPGPPRPDDMTELARLVARELRKRAIRAMVSPDDAPQVVFVPRAQWGNVGTLWRAYSMYRDDFDNLTSRECADAIQAQEAAKAAEWAGDG